MCVCGNLQTSRVWGYSAVKEDQRGGAGDCAGEGLASYFLGTFFRLPSELLFSSSPGPMSVNREVQCPACHGVTGSLECGSRILELKYLYGTKLCPCYGRRKLRGAAVSVGSQCTDRGVC